MRGGAGEERVEVDQGETECKVEGTSGVSITVCG